MSPREAPNPNTKLILKAYCEYVGDERVYKVPKFMAAAKTLAGYGLKPEQMKPLLMWCRTTWLGKDGVDMMTALTLYWQWVGEGRPGAPVTLEDKIKALLESTDPKYAGSAGARERARDIAALKEADET